MSDRAFVDTNIVVYLFDDDEPDKQTRAGEVLTETDETVFVVSTQVLAEFYVTVTNKLGRPLDPRSARQAVAELASLPVVSTDATLVRAGIDTAQAHRLSLWDALIVEAAASGGCNRVISEDLNHGAVLRGVSIENPFR